jgi:polysaccharide chain length determinant protein (PEP-CTERM system associated)
MKDEIMNSPLTDAVLEKWRRRKWLMISCFFLAFSVAASFVLALPSLYMSTTTIQFGQDGFGDSLVKGATPSELELRLGMVTQSVLSRDQLQEVIDVFNLYPSLRLKDPAESVIKRFRKDISIDQRTVTLSQRGQNPTYSLAISYQGWDPDLVARVANDLAVRFKSENEKFRTDQAVRTTEFLRTQLEEGKARYSAEEKRINEFKNAHMGELPEQQAINLATLERLNSELRLKGEKEVQLLSRRSDLLFGSNSGTQNSSVNGLTGSLRLDRLQRDLTEMKLHYTPSYPGVIRLTQEIDKLKQELQASPAAKKSDPVRQAIQNPAEIDLELATLKKEESALAATIGELVARIDDMPLVDQQLKRLTSDYDSARDGYLSLQKHYQDARLTESLEQQQSQQFNVLEVAIPPYFPAAPNQRRLLLMAFLMAIGVSGGAGLFAESMDRSFHSAAAIRRFTNIPVLAVIGDIQTRGDKWRHAIQYPLVGAVVIAVIIIMAKFSHTLGTQAQQLVWLLAE